MKTYRLITFSAILMAFIACNQNSDNSGGENQKENTEHDTQDEANVTDDQKPETTSDEEATEKTEPIKTAAADRTDYKLSELKNGAEIDGMPVSGYFYEPGDEYYFDLTGERILKGKLQKDPMSEMPSIMVENKELSQINLTVNGQKLPIFKYIQISNKNVLKEAMDDEMLNRYNEGEKISVKIKVNNFTQGGKIDGFGGMNTTFVSFE